MSASDSRFRFVQCAYQPEPGESPLRRRELLRQVVRASTFPAGDPNRPHGRFGEASATSVGRGPRRLAILPLPTAGGLGGSERHIPGDPMRNKLLQIGTCTVCGTGNVGIRVSESGACMVAMCDECDAVWNDKRMNDGPHFPGQPHLPCTGDGSSLRYQPAHWATGKEAAESGWGDAIIGESDTPEDRAV